MTGIIELQDNTVAEHSIENQKAGSAHNYELIAYQGLWSALTGVEKRARRVLSEDNWIADPGSRPDLHEELQAAKAKWTSLHNREISTPPQAPSELTDLHHWVNPDLTATPTERVNRVWGRIGLLLDYYESVGCTLISDRVDHSEVRRIIKQSLAGAPIQPSPPFDEDFPETPPQSGARSLLAPIGKRVRVHTRSTLLKKALNKAKADTGQTGPAIMLNKGDEILTKINAAMAAQYTQRDVLWKDNANYDPSLPPRQSAPVINQPFDLTDPIRVSLYQAGQLGWGKAAEDSGGGKVVGASEWQPSLRNDAPRVLSPDVVTYRDDALQDAQQLTRLKAEASYHGPTCCTMATSNDNPTYNRATADQDPAELGLQFEHSCDAAANAYSGFGLAFGLVECVPGAAYRGPNGEPSALDRLRQEQGHKYHFLDYVINAKDVTSPLTGNGAAYHEPRLYVPYYHKEIWAQPPHLDLSDLSQVHSNCADFVSSDRETPGFYTMPIEDVEGFQFKFRKGGEDKSIAFMGKISSPNKGFGEGAFPTEAWDPALGLPPAGTAAQQRWSLRTVVGEPAFVQPPNEEIAREMGLRDLMPELLHPKSEFGRYVLANAVVQPTADWWVVQQFQQYLDTDPDTGLTYREKYHRCRAEFQLLSNTAGEGSARRPSHFKAALQHAKKKHTQHDNAARPAVQTPIRKPRGRKPPSCDAGMMQAVRAHIPHIRSKAKKPETLSRKDANVVHFCDFREAQKLPTTIKDASLPSVQQELMEYISYESCIHKIKGSSIGPKLSSIDNWHVKNGYEPPFMVAFTAKDFFDDVKALDAAACPKIPVPAQCISRADGAPQGATATRA